MADAPKIIQTGPNKDSLKTGFDKFNQAIDNANEALKTADIAKTSADSAVTTANAANEKSDFTQVQLDTVTGASTIDPAVEQMKVDLEGVVHQSPDARLRSELEKRDAQLAEIAINVKSFGAKGDGITDDTAAIQAAVNYAETNKLTRVEIKDGDFLIDAAVSVYLKSGITYSIENATLKAKPNSLGRYHILYCKNASNITIQGNNALIYGDRNEHTNDPALPAGQNEQGFGLKLQDSNNIVIKDIKFQNCWGDGIMVSWSNDVLIDHVICDNNRRQGLSVVTAKNIIIQNSTFSNTNGTAPQSGIDLEPDSMTETNRNENIKILNCNFENNLGAGVWVTVNTVNAVIDSCYFDKNYYGIRLFGVDGSPLPTSIIISKNTIKNSTSRNITLLKASDVKVLNNKLTVVNTSNFKNLEANTVTNVIISGNYVETNGIDVSNVTNYSVLDNYIFNTPLGIYCYSSVNGHIRNNRISSQNGIDLYSNCKQVKVTHNIVDGVADVDNAYFIRLRNSQYCEVAENTMKGTFTSGVRTVTQLTCDSCRIIGNDDRQVTGTNVVKTERYQSTNIVYKPYNLGILSGTTAQRPSSTAYLLTIGDAYFDTTLGKQVFWNGTAWVDGNGTVV